MPRAGFEPTTPATKRPQTYPLDRAATGIGIIKVIKQEKWIVCHVSCMMHMKKYVQN
jgi:hypothetical protein